jgi:hypothetical protein
MIINTEMNKEGNKKNFRRKNTTFGLKFKFLARTPHGNLLGEENAIKRAATVVYDALFSRGINVCNVYFKAETLDFFIETEKDLISMNSLHKDWVNMYKTNWGKVFFNITVGQYTIYEDQYENITKKVENYVTNFVNKSDTPSDLWFKTNPLVNTRCDECGHITYGISAWKFTHEEKEYIEEVRINETGNNWELEPLVEKYGEDFSFDILEGEEVCPICNNRGIYPVLKEA